MERRNNAGKIAYKTLEEAWQGSNEDNFILLDLLDQLRTDPGLLSSETVLEDLNDELAPVSAQPFQPLNKHVTSLNSSVMLISGNHTLQVFLLRKGELMA